ncbi:MAG: hypothetical protein QOI35_972 [Cryptosporangiaceae bacterium]|nr:hypothetical protein [Cryptosporangiaceae bacterium]
MPLRPRSGAYLAAILAVALLPGSPAHASPRQAAAKSASVAPVLTASRTITLITGDRLAISAEKAQRVTALPSAGRAGVRFVSRTVQGGHLEVVPQDALPLIASGQVDARLFDVTQLLADGFGDDRAGAIPLIVSTSGNAPQSLAAGRALPAVRGRAVMQAKSGAASLWKSVTTARGLTAGVTRIRLDGRVKVSLDVSVPQIGAPTAWAAGYTGAGVDVGVIDTGVDATHPDLKDAVVESRNFLVAGPPPGPPGQPGPPIPAPPVEDGKDYKGHGTHVASIIAGRGTASAGRYKGVAPAARIHSFKACDRSGTCTESSLIAAMEAAAQEKLRVVNMSIGQPNQVGQDPLEEAVQTLTAKYGTLFVVASGNDSGPANSPSTAPDALSVGAVDKQDNIAGFSSGGSLQGELIAKPEVTAPGVSITAAQSTTRDGGDSNPYVTFSGTSMATPHVTGAVALLAPQQTEWTHDPLKAALVSSAKPSTAITAERQGAGRIDVGRAITQHVTASPVSLSFGEHDWPHADDQPVSHTVTYANSGATPQTLAISAAATTQNGAPTAAGLVRLSASSVTVPAGGTADVTVTVSPAADAQIGWFSGLITAAGGGTAVQTPWVLYKDIEAYNLTVTHVDRTGAPATAVRTQIYSLDVGDQYGITISKGVGTVRLPKGNYTVASQFYTAGQLTTLVAPNVTVGKDSGLTMDARIAKPLSATVPDPTASQYFGHIHFTIGTKGGRILGEDMTGPDFDGMYSGQVGRDDLAITSTVSGSWAKRDADGSIDTSPYLYNLAWNQLAHYPTGFQRKAGPADLATVTERFASEIAGSEGGITTSNRFTGDLSRGWAVYAGLAVLPTTRTVFHNTDGGAEFRTEFGSGTVSADGEQHYLSTHRNRYTAYEAGKKYFLDWNRAVYGPAFPQPQENLSWFDREESAYRTGNQVIFWPSVFSDGAERTGEAETASERITITRDGQPVLDEHTITTGFVAPAASGVYTATIALTRAAPAELATSSTTTWTFRSAATAKRDYLPLAAILISPQVDDTNTAPGGSLALPVRVQRQPGSAVGATTSLSVEVSFDGGTTWVTPPLIGSGDARVAQVQHPKGHGFVSIRAKAASASGSTVAQTIISAYRY